MKKILCFLIGASLIVLLASPSYAVQIWADSFNRANSNTVGNGWYEIENDADDVAVIETDRMILRDKQEGFDAVAGHLVDLSDYRNITLEFQWFGLPTTEAADKLRVGWKDSAGTDWTYVFEHDLGDDSRQTDMITDWKGNIDNFKDFEFMFRTSVSAASEGVKIDWVKISGDYAPVPEPATMLLFGIGLLGLAGVNRRKK